MVRRNPHQLNSLWYTRNDPAFTPVYPCSLHILPFFLGSLIVLFFNCMAALFSPAYRRGEGVKWGLVIYTVVMFSLVTVYTATKGHILSICYIDNRGFPDDGPWGYHEANAYSAIWIIARAAFNLNNWMADGLLVSSSFDAATAHPDA